MQEPLGKDCFKTKSVPVTQGGRVKSMLGLISSAFGTESSQKLPEDHFGRHFILQVQYL